MDVGADKNWATEYVLDPLNGPDPSQETGLNSSFRPERVDSKVDKKTSSVHVREQSTGSSSTNPFRNRASSNPFRSGASSNPFRDPADLSTRAGRASHSRNASRASNGSAGRLSADYRAEAFPDLDGVPRRSGSGRSHSSAQNCRPRRSSSLRERYPGDPSVHPLEQLMRETKLADRSPHLKKKHLNGPDSVDRMDAVGLGSGYHHEGPYDAASLARNNSLESAPLSALRETNAEALKATPKDKIRDSLNGHMPLDGTAIFPPGMNDPMGQHYDYEEGTDMMREANPEGGAYKRWPGVDYLPEDLKGKGEPSYTKDKLEKELKLNRRSRNGSNSIELEDRPRSVSGGSAGARLSGEIKRHLGSFRRKDK